MVMRCFLFVRQLNRRFAIGAQGGGTLVVQCQWRLYFTTKLPRGQSSEDEEGVSAFVPLLNGCEGWEDELTAAGWPLSAGLFKHFAMDRVLLRINHFLEKPNADGQGLARFLLPPLHQNQNQLSFYEIYRRGISPLQPPSRMRSCKVHFQMIDN